MTRIASSTYTVGPAQADGRSYIRERHDTDDGNSIEFEWLGDPAIAQAVLTQRAATLDAQYQAEEAAAAIVAGTLIPLTKLQFRELFTPTERAGIDAFRAGLESNPGLTMEQKASIRTGFFDFDAARQIDRPFKPPVVAMLALFVSLGLLTTARRDAIVEAGNG